VAEKPKQPRRIATGALALTLWLATAVLGFWEIYLVREMLFRIYARFGSDYWSAVNLGKWVVVVLGAVWLAFVVGGGEHHRRRVGQRSSWSLFGWTIGVEVAILILNLFL